uniref:Uncharacterized protein n=1 Tax=Aegilops tauschii subsp. strangulata TaxID=200361 RepID=A0A453G6B7_AEGTS
HPAAAAAARPISGHRSVAPSPANTPRRESSSSPNALARLPGASHDRTHGKIIIKVSTTQSCHPATASASEGGSNAHRAGDVSINKADIVEPANEIDPPMDHSIVDNCVDANPTMEKSIPPWKRSFQLPTNERQGAEAEEIENLHVQISPLKCKLNKVPYYRSICDERQQVEVYRRLSRYYIQAHELPSPGEEPDNAQLSKELERCLDAYEINFLQRAKDNPEWYFHPEQCKLAGLEDYQRLVLRDHGMYGDLKQYRLYYHTYQGDVEYVQFREQMAEQIKWIDDEAALFGDQRLRNELEAFLQTLRIAMRFPNISGRSVVSALREHLYSLRFDFNHRKDLDGVYLEIWKRVARNKMNFGDALKQLYEENIFPFRRPDIKLALDSYPGPSWINSCYDTYVAGIDEGFSEDEAHPLIIEAVEKMWMPILLSS